MNAAFVDDCWSEAPGIINRLAEAASRLAQRGRYVLPPDHEALVLQMQYREPPDHVARLSLESAPGERVWSAQLQLALRIVARDLGDNQPSPSPSKWMKTLSGMMKTLYGVTRHGRDRQVFYAGVRLRPGY